MESILTERMVQKTQFISELHQERGSRFFMCLMGFIQLSISEAREDNDTADMDRVKVNQGKIEAYKHLIDSIERGVIVNTRD